MLALALTGLAAAVWRHGGDAVLLAAAVAIGLTLPAFSAALRALWPQVIPGTQMAPTPSTHSCTNCR